MTLTLSLAVISFCGSSFAASSNDTNMSGAGFEAIESSEKVKQELMAQYGENKPIGEDCEEVRKRSLEI
jgi:hypothetical protein